MGICPLLIQVERSSKICEQTIHADLAHPVLDFLIWILVEVKMHKLEFIAKRVGMHLQYHCIKSQNAGFKVASSDRDKVRRQVMIVDNCSKLVCAIVYLTVAKFSKQITKRNHALIDCAKKERNKEDSHVATDVN
jgi:hypothetical protein